jgi:hypothetical protein
MITTDNSNFVLAVFIILTYEPYFIHDLQEYFNPVSTFFRPRATFTLAY